MLLIIAVLAILSAASLFYLRYWRQRQAHIDDQEQYLPEQTDLRPLFLPDKQEIARIERANMREAEEAAKASLETRSNDEFSRAYDAWRESPDRKTAIGLLGVAADGGHAERFSTAASEILRVHREAGIDRLTDNDMAALLDSHHMLLPVTERSSGALFWVKQEIATLRSGLKEEVG